MMLSAEPADGAHAAADPGAAQAAGVPPKRGYLRQTVDELFYRYGLFCASHPIAVIVLVAVAVFVCSAPLVRFALNEVYDPPLSMVRAGDATGRRRHADQRRLGPDAAHCMRSGTTRGPWRLRSGPALWRATGASQSCGCSTSFWRYRRTRGALRDVLVRATGELQGGHQLRADPARAATAVCTASCSQTC